jgi:hypothetical protein
MTARTIAVYSALCAMFWLVAVYNPIRWSSLFLKADSRHLYVHVFYGSLLVLGLLTRVPAPKGVMRSAITGAIVGLVSSVIAILSVYASRVSLDVMLDRMPREGGPLTLAAVWAIYSVILGGPLWGALLATLYQALARRLPVTRQDRPTV